MRYYLDTNILVFLRLKNLDELSIDIKHILEDYSSILYTSSVCVQELIHLCQIGKLGSKSGLLDSAKGVLDWLDIADIRIESVTERHLKLFSQLPFHSDHRDPNDRLIIAQAISDRIPLISSDHKFSLYTSDGLDFVYNKR